MLAVARAHRDQADMKEKTGKEERYGTHGSCRVVNVMNRAKGIIGSEEVRKVTTR